MFLRQTEQGKYRQMLQTMADKERGCEGCWGDGGGQHVGRDDPRHISCQQAGVGFGQLMSQGDQELPEDLLGKATTPAASLPCAYGDALAFQAAGKALQPKEGRSACFTVAVHRVSSLCNLSTSLLLNGPKGNCWAVGTHQTQHAAPPCLAPGGWGVPRGQRPTEVPGERPGGQTPQGPPGSCRDCGEVPRTGLVGRDTERLGWGWGGCSAGRGWCVPLVSWSSAGLRGRDLLELACPWAVPCHLPPVPPGLGTTRWGSRRRGKQLSQWGTGVLRILAKARPGSSVVSTAVQRGKPSPLAGLWRWWPHVWCCPSSPH